MCWILFPGFSTADSGLSCYEKPATSTSTCATTPDVNVGEHELVQVNGDNFWTVHVDLDAHLHVDVNGFCLATRENKFTVQMLHSPFYCNI